MKKTNAGRIIVIIVLVLVGVLICAEMGTHFIQKWISNVLYDNRVPYLSCEEMPELADIEQTVAAHQDVIEQIEGIDPGFIRVYISDSEACPEKGILVIEYASHANREQIEALIGDTFFGIPWKGLNV